MIYRYSIWGLIFLSFIRAEAQYISEVIEYQPAPGQFINEAPWGVPGSTGSLVGGVNGTLCLGSFGGYVVFRFDQPVENHPDNPYGIDFTLFGNPVPDWAEPGIVSVMVDENGNGIPDENWYELAGSDFHFSSTIRDYKVTYFNPGDSVASDVQWIDNAGNSGVVMSNSAHMQPYYPGPDMFPGIPVDEYAHSGTLINTIVETAQNGELKSVERAFGYADNHFRGSAPYTKPDNPYTSQIEYSGGDGFDIHWAVDSTGRYMDLDRIHFVKVYTAVNLPGGQMGELSTEITGAVDVQADPSISGKQEIVVIKDLPREIQSPEYQLEPFAFNKGRIQPGKRISWITSLKGSSVDENHLLSLSGSGELVLTAYLIDNPEISATVSTIVNLDNTYSAVQEGNKSPKLYPNPVKNLFRISGIQSFIGRTGTTKVSIIDRTGRLCKEVPYYRENSPVIIDDLKVGLYLVRIDNDSEIFWQKLIKE